jgi:hypothetical protein
MVTLLSARFENDHQLSIIIGLVHPDSFHGFSAEISVGEARGQLSREYGIESIRCM